MWMFLSSIDLNGPIPISKQNYTYSYMISFYSTRFFFSTKDGLPGPLLTVERPTDGHAEGTTGATAVKRRSVTAQTPPVLNDRFSKSVHSPVFFRIALFCFMGCFSSLCIKWAVVFCWLLMNSLEKYWNCGTASLEPQNCTRNWRRIAPWRKSTEDATSQSFLLTNQSLWLCEI